MERGKLDFVVTGYIFDKYKLLLIHHRKRDMWLPVGGHIEQNEAPDDALAREIKEETGLNVEILQDKHLLLKGDTKRQLAVPFHVNIHNVGDHDHCSFFYICKALNPDGLEINSELKGFKWVSKEELNSEFVPKDVRDIGLKAFELIG